jgi:DNA invertase Pin-like site-specific DNA recombinase
MDKQQISFVSITQQFNTTTSMGRLTLNVLLSFAQFEREVTGERIRDKIAMSKKKGKWMGGFPPLGYDCIERKLVVNKKEAQTLNLIFKKYIELKSVFLLKIELDNLGIVTKKRKFLTEREIGGKPYFKGNLYSLLQNKIYVGEIVHRDNSYPGEHEGIVDPAIFKQAQDSRHISCYFVFL